MIALTAIVVAIGTWMKSSILVGCGYCAVAGNSAIEQSSLMAKLLICSGKMPRVILTSLLTVCTTLFAASETAGAREPAAKDEIACYNVMTGRTFSAAECDFLVCRGKDGSGRAFSGTKGHHGDGYGPCIRPREEGERNNEIECQFGPGFLESRGKPVQAFSSPVCAEAKMEFRQCLNGTLLGSYPYPNCR